MQKLYLDCDGVILDTINKSYEIMKEKQITDILEKSKFYRNLNWNEFILEAGEIDNAIKKIRILSEYFDIEILTHVNSQNESLAKLNYFSEVLNNIKVNTVPKTIEKADYVDPNGAILVDDYLPNLDYWQKKGGLSIKFSDSGKKCKYRTITDLLELIPSNESDKINV